MDFFPLLTITYNSSSFNSTCSFIIESTNWFCASYIYTSTGHWMLVYLYRFVSTFPWHLLRFHMFVYIVPSFINSGTLKKCLSPIFKPLSLADILYIQLYKYLLVIASILYAQSYIFASSYVWFCISISPYFLLTFSNASSTVDT